MSAIEKMYKRLNQKKSVKDTAFDDINTLLLHNGCIVLNVQGSHYHYYHPLMGKDKFLTVVVHDHKVTAWYIKDAIKYIEKIKQLEKMERIRHYDRQNT